MRSHTVMDSPVGPLTITVWLRIRRLPHQACG